MAQDQDKGVWVASKVQDRRGEEKFYRVYYDTDSVIYNCRDGQTKLETGDFLGEMTDELDGDTIEEFGCIPEVLGAHVPVKGDSHVLIVKRLRDGRKARFPQEI